MSALTLRIDDELHDRLRAYSFQTHIPMSRILSVALISYLELMGDEDRPDTVKHVLTRTDAGPCYGENCDHVSHGTRERA